MEYLHGFAMCFQETWGRGTYPSFLMLRLVDDGLGIMVGTWNLGFNCLCVLDYICFLHSVLLCVGISATYVRCQPFGVCSFLPAHFTMGLVI